MRLKNVKGAKEKVENSSYVLTTSNYHPVFTNNHPLHIEIGMGKGQFIYNQALNHPDINYIGIEKYDSVLVRALEKQEQNPLPNLYFFKMDALDIDKYFKNEVDLIYLNFSDPWPKDRHAKRRLTHENFLKKYDTIFKDQKEIKMKTDNRHLFEYSIQSLTNYGYKIQDITLDLYQDDIKDNVPTEYEQKFHEKGYPIYQIHVKK